MWPAPLLPPGLRPSCLIPVTYGVGSFGRRKANAVRLWQMHGPVASRTYAAAAYFNTYKYLPPGWNWIATKHVVALPPPLDSAAIRTSDASGQSDSQLALEDSRPSRPTPVSPSPAPSGIHPAPTRPRGGQPPPPFYPENPSARRKSARASRPSYTYGKHPWDGDWQSTNDGKWRWKGIE